MHFIHTSVSRVVCTSLLPGSLVQEESERQKGNLVLIVSF